MLLNAVSDDDEKVCLYKEMKRPFTLSDPIE
jgi:hypothetical protein